MKITREYIVETVNRLMVEKQKENRGAKQSADKLYAVKMRFPKWLRMIVFHPLNPFYSVFVQYKASKVKVKDSMKLQSLQPFAVDFYQYCNRVNLDFDVSQFYPQEDLPEIKFFIENRLKSVIPGYTSIKMNADQLDIRNQKDQLRSRVQKTGEWFKLSLNNTDYYLPENNFEEHTYIHSYGLKLLPAELVEYIEGKDLLDIGAYLGDTTIFLKKNYKLRNAFAYEPVSVNAEQLEKTLVKNDLADVEVVRKGLGEEQGQMDIFISLQQTSSSTINEQIADRDVVKESIEITTLDDECANKHIGLIKMDIEGAEFGAIKGGLQTIKRDKPVLLISMYHTGKDFFEIPPMLKEAVPEYQFRFVNIELTNPFSEKILLAYPKI